LAVYLRVTVRAVGSGDWEAKGLAQPADTAAQVFLYSFSVPPPLPISEFLRRKPW
jgi:hypothetical protein